MEYPTGYYVYLLYEPGQAEPFYVGKGSGRRAWEHLESNVLARSPDPCHRKIESLLSKGIKYEVDIISMDLTEPESLSLEISTIARFGRRDLGRGSLLNLTNGGDGVSGHKHSDESRAKIRAARARQAPPSAKQRQLTSERMVDNQYAKGIKDTLAQSLAKSQRQQFKPIKGHTQNEITRSSISHGLKIAYQTGKRLKNFKPVIGKYNGEIVHRFDCVGDAHRSGFHINKALKEGIKAYRCLWEYA